MIETILHFFQVRSGLDVEIFRIAFVASLLISLFVAQRKKNVPIGIIAPGTLLLLLGYPTKILLVVSISLLVYGTAWIIQKYILPHMILAAREKLLMLVLLSITYSVLITIFFEMTIEVLTAGAIGIVLPAMVAENLTKAHRIPRLISFVQASFYSVMFFIVLKLASMQFLSASYKAELDVLYPPTNLLGTQSILVMYSLFALATIFNITLYRKKKFKTSGLLLGAYLGLLIFQPAQILFIVLVVGLSYFIVRKLFSHTMLYGYRIFVVSTLIVSTIFSLFERVAYTLSQGSFHAFLGLHIAGIVVCGLLVSETIQHGYKKVFVGSLSMTGIIALSLLLMQTVSHATHGNFTIASLLERTDYSKSNTYEYPKEAHAVTPKSRAKILTIVESQACETEATKITIEKHNQLLPPAASPTQIPLSSGCIL